MEGRKSNNNKQCSRKWSPYLFCKAMLTWAELGMGMGCVHAKLLQSCLTLCNPMDYSLPGSSVHGIFQARILECVALPSSSGSFWPRDRTHVFLHLSALAGGFFTTSTTWEAPCGWVGATLIPPCLQFRGLTLSSGIPHWSWEGPHRSHQ